MKKRLFKLIILISISFVFLISTFLLFDLAKYDSSYINRSSLTFSVNNLNSHHAKKIYKNYIDFYNYIKFKTFKNSKKIYQVKKKSLRENLPKIKVLHGKKSNFINGKKIKEIEKNFSNWTRSHGGFSSMRFSSLEKINGRDPNIAILNQERAVNKKACCKFNFLS